MSDDPNDVRDVLTGRADRPGWGRVANADEDERYMRPVTEDYPGDCSCGCEGPITHVGMANGLGMIAGCELSVRRWVGEDRQSYINRVQRLHDEHVARCQLCKVADHCVVAAHRKAVLDAWNE